MPPDPLLLPPAALQHMKASRGHTGLIPATDMNFDQWAIPSEGLFPTPPHPRLLPFPLALKLEQLQMSVMLV